MDERLDPFVAGEPIPAWDLRHRLPVSKPVGPDCADCGTIFRINSTYMDVSDQPHMNRQHVGIAVLMIACSACAALAVPVAIYL